MDYDVTGSGYCIPNRMQVHKQRTDFLMILTVWEKYKVSVENSLGLGGCLLCQLIIARLKVPSQLGQLGFVRHS